MYTYGFGKCLHMHALNYYAFWRKKNPWNWEVGIDLQIINKVNLNVYFLNPDGSFHLHEHLGWAKSPLKANYQPWSHLKSDLQKDTIIQPGINWLIPLLSFLEVHELLDFCIKLFITWILIY